LRVKPDSFNPTLAPGQIVRVRLDRVASTGAASVHDYLYEVEQIGRSATGEVQLELTEFPVDANGGSVVAQEVAAAVGQGILLPTGKSGVSCDVNSSSDTTVPADTSVTGWTAEGIDADGDPYTVDWDEGGDEFEAGITPVTPSTVWYGGYGVTNPNDNLSNQGDVIAPFVGLEPEGALPGLPLTTEGTICAGGTFQWLRDGVPIAGATSSSYTPGADDIGTNVTSKVTCPDGSSTTSDPISVAVPTEFRFNQPISATVYYTQKSGSAVTIFCNTTPSVSAPTSNTGSGTRSFSNVSRIQPVGFISVPGSASTVTGYKGPASSYSKSCGTSSWVDGNVGIIGILNDAVTSTQFLGGGSGYSSSTTSGLNLKISLQINDIILNANAPGLGVTGDSVWRAGLGWYADVSYLERNYGQVYIDGVLQPFNPFGPPTTP
jgi:hypothetical protein